MKSIKPTIVNINGIDVVFLKREGALTSYVGFQSLSGAYAEKPEEYGVAHFLEHMFFKGTKNRSYEDIVQDGALLSGIQNAFTSTYDTSYYIGSFPFSNLDASLDLLSDMMFNSDFPEEELEKERGVIQEERKEYDDDHSSFYFHSLMADRFNSQMNHDIIGTEETINNITRETIVNYRKRMYGKENTILLVVSPLEEEEVFDICRKYLKYNTFDNIVVPSVEEELLINNEKDITIQRSGIQQIYASMVFNENGGMKDGSAKHKCLMSALGGGMYSILFKEIREKLGLCYHIGHSNIAKNNTKSVGALYSVLNPDKRDVFKSKMEEVVRDVAKNGIDEKTYDCAKANMMGSYCRIFEDPTKLVRTISKHILFNNFFDYRDQYDEVLALNYEEVNEYAKEFLSNIQYSWYIMEPSE